MKREMLKVCCIRYCDNPCYSIIISIEIICLLLLYSSIRILFTFCTAGAATAASRV